MALHTVGEIRQSTVFMKILYFYSNRYKWDGQISRNTSQENAIISQTRSLLTATYVIVKLTSAWWVFSQNNYLYLTFLCWHCNVLLCLIAITLLYITKSEQYNLFYEGTINRQVHVDIYIDKITRWWFLFLTSPVNQTLERSRNQCTSSHSFESSIIISQSSSFILSVLPLQREITKGMPLSSRRRCHTGSRLFATQLTCASRGRLSVNFRGLWSLRRTFRLNPNASDLSEAGGRQWTITGSAAVDWVSVGSSQQLLEKISWQVQTKLVLSRIFTYFLLFLASR